jgi:hypothetical protein
MAEVLAEFANEIMDDDGVVYRAQATGGVMPDGRWEAWIEFVPIAGETHVLRTPRETTQPNRRDAVYWATGITGIYLEGALKRASNPRIEHVSAPPEPMFDEPAPHVVRVEHGPSRNAVLHPFEVYEQDGEDILRAKLAALESYHLVSIIAAHGLSDEPVALLEAHSQASLIEIIVAAVRVSFRR